MDLPLLRILLIEDNPGDARLIREMLSENQHGALRVEWVTRLSLGIERLAEGGIDLVLLDLSLPDSQGLQTCRTIREEAEDVVVIVFTGFDDADMGTRAVQEGAQDYLVKGKVDGALLIRSIRYAIERQQMVRQLKALSVTDQLTGLYNRRGLTMSGEQMTKLARRLGQEVYLLFTDVDGLKGINDTLGHGEGDRALQDLARLLKGTFRDSDVIARIGGDEFVVLGTCSSADAARVARGRLVTALQEHNRRPGARYELSISAGIVSCGPAELTSIEDMLVQADALMYAQKKDRLSKGVRPARPSGATPISRP